MSSLHVHFLPALVDPEFLRNGTVVVIDVLRATTTIAAAIAAGAREVIPCAEVEEALRIAGKFAQGEVVLGGERGGLLIPGFDLGNSPCDYTPERVGGKTVVFTTTNGTQAMFRCRQAARVLTAGFVNVSAIARAVQDVAQAADETERIHLLCAGTRAQITREDVLLAGCLAERISDFAREADEPPPNYDDQTLIAMDVWRPVDTEAGELLRANIGFAMTECIGGRDLVQLGFNRDILDAARMDRWDCVPELNLAEWAIRGRRE